MRRLKHCNKFIPNIKILLQMFVDLLVSTATAEKIFSTLRKLKNYLISEVRLNGLSMLNVHKRVDINQVIYTFLRKQKRNMELGD